MKYYVIQCDRCKKFQSCIVRNLNSYRFSCRLCRKTKKIRKKNQLGLTLKTYGPYSPKEISKICSIKNSKNI